MKIKVVVLFILVSLSAFCQKPKVKKDTLYTFCGKKVCGQVEIKQIEFLKCDKKIEPLIEGDSILYYEFGVVVNGSYATLHYDYRQNKPEDMANTFNTMKKGDFFIIEKVGIYRKDKIVVTKGFTIKII